MVRLQVIQRIAGYPRYGLRYDREATRTQLEIVRDVMLSAAECGAWVTLTEISPMTRFGEASISAQLRHLRRQVFGGYRVEKRRRATEDCAVMTAKVNVPGKWEYRIVNRVSAF
jgi:hypothetical protein